MARTAEQIREAKRKHMARNTGGMKMGYYRKKPVTVEAYQWWKNGDHPDDAPFRRGDDRAPCEGLLVRYYRRPDVRGESLCEQCGKTYHVHGWIDTKEHGHRVCPGDWIIKGVRGEYYPCKPDIFEATYEPATPTQEGA